MRALEAFGGVPELLVTDQLKSAVTGAALLERRIPERLADGLELGVAVMLVLLGARALRRSLREGSQGQAVPHVHGGVLHTHTGQGGHLHWGTRAYGTRSLLVGLVHGLAGSGAMTALVMAHLPTTLFRLVYILLFGLGSVAGMGLLTAMAGVSLSRLLTMPGLHRALLGATGALSSLLGLAWGVGPVIRLWG